MNIKWNFPLSALCLQWPNQLPVGQAHLAEHLIYRTLKNDMNGLNTFYQSNGKTDQLALNVHCVGSEIDSLKFSIDRLMTSPFQEVTQALFLEEQKVVVQEISEKGSLLERIINQFLQESWGYDKREIDVTGDIEDIKNLSFEELAYNFSKVKEKVQLLELLPKNGHEVSSWKPDLLEKPLTYHGAIFSTAAKSGLFLGFRVSNHSLLERLKLHLTEYALKFGPERVNLNDWVRKEKGLSYGFHSTVVNLGQELSRSLLTEIDQKIGDLESLTRDELVAISSRLDMDSHYYRSPSQMINYLPTYAMLFGEAATQKMASGYSMIDHISHFNALTFKKLEN